MHRIAVFASGKGTNFEAIVTACNNAELDAQVVLLVCDKPQAEVVAKAERFGIECFAFNPKEYSSKEQYEAQIVELLDRAEVELVCLAGYMRIVGPTLLSAYGGKIINIHGKIIAQRAFEYDGNDAEQVHRIGQQIEHKLYVETIKKILK